MDSRYKKHIIVVSILVHLLIFLVLNLAVEWKIIGFNRQPVLPLKNQPIVFDLKQPDFPREVIETPEDARIVKQQKKADFLSDKNALARNPETEPELESGDAFSRGDFESHDLPEVDQKKAEAQPPEDIKRQKDQFTEIKENMEKNKTGAFYKDYVFKDQDLKKPGPKDQFSTVKHNQQKLKALEEGGLSFNTYNWNFAPYLLRLKNRIRSNIYPPIAFTRLGMISGETFLRFRIYPGGELRNLKILGYRGDESLMKTSQTAVEISAPFPELPLDFPEPYLVVTGRFLYLIKKPEKQGE
ncbi:MAG: hypothetical protein KAT17_07730 [Candidatus Aminicenantes bacterium]|nr:hypothetical protein [Candidatus Aminicenantes bacterium]